jgi:hypothetical protein
MAERAMSSSTRFVRPGADVTGTVALSLILQLFVMSWELTVLLALALCLAVVDLVFRPWTARLRLGGRIVLSVLAIGFVAYQMYPTITDRFEAAYQIGKYAPPPGPTPTPHKPIPPKNTPTSKAPPAVPPAELPKPLPQHQRHHNTLPKATDSGSTAGTSVNICSDNKQSGSHNDQKIQCPNH